MAATGRRRKKGLQHGGAENGRARSSGSSPPSKVEGFTLPVICATATYHGGRVMTTTSGSEDDIATRSARPDSKRPTVAKRLSTLVASILVLAILTAAGFAAFALVRGTWMVTPVLSGSMRPGLAVGGVVISERVPVNHLAVRDVIVFRQPNNPSKQVVHRIIRIAQGNSGQLLINTQGDANTVRDPWTLTIRGDYAYQVRWSVPLLGYIAIAFQNHRGIALLVSGFVLIVIAFTTVFSSRRRRRHRRRIIRSKRQIQPGPTPPSASDELNGSTVDTQPGSSESGPLPAGSVQGS